jgi:hypothetical protein
MATDPYRFEITPSTGGEAEIMKRSSVIAAMFLWFILASHATAQTPAVGKPLEFPSLGNNGPRVNNARSLSVSRSEASEGFRQRHVDEPSIRQRKIFDHGKVTNQNGLPTWPGTVVIRGFPRDLRISK